MSVVSVRPRDFILALFIRDDGERFLLGDNGYDFKDSQLHFAANSIENDEVQKQGADGVMIAGQVRRASVQSFDGFVGDATDLKETIEEMRRDFIAFFAKGHHFRVIYVDTSRNAWQRKGGYLVDAPEVKELYQMHPEYHVGLNFEDVNYYSYDEDADGNEILANLVDIPVSTEASGGLVWDEDGAVSEDAEVVYDTETADASGKSISISDAAEAPLASFQLDGETSQNGTPTPDAPVEVSTTTGENVAKICGKNLLDSSNYIDAYIDSSGIIHEGTGVNALFGYIGVSPSTSYTISASSSTRFSAAFYNGETYISRDNNHDGTSYTFTTPNNCNRIRCWVWRQSGVDQSYINSLNLQLELGSATAYEPYREQSYPISLGSLELCKIGDYQDYIYKSGDKWYVRKECGGASLSDYANTASRLTTNTSGKYRFRLVVPGVLPAATTGMTVPSYCSHLGTGTAGNTYTMSKQCIAIDVGTNNYVFIFTTDTEAMSVDDFKAWLTGKNMSFYYPLATPTDTEITNEALVGQLEALLTTARTYAGVNNIFTITPNEQGTLEISYYTKYQPRVTAGGYIWEAGGSGGATTVVNNSIGNVNPIWKVYGPTNNPTLENTTTGEQIEYVGLVADGQTLTIDMGAQTASLDGLNVISNVVGDYISLAPGANKLVYSVTGEAGASELGWSEIVG